MLPAGSRLRHRAEFTAAVRGSRPCRGNGLLVVHAVAPDRNEDAASGSFRTTRAGLVVSRGVGAAVTRNRVKRRLRHVLAPLLGTLPPGTVVVVRALPACATASFSAVEAALDAALRQALRQASERALERAREPAPRRTLEQAPAGASAPTRGSAAPVRSS